MLEEEVLWWWHKRSEGKWQTLIGKKEISRSVYLFWYKQPETALWGGKNPILAFCSPCLWRSMKAFLTFVGLFPFTRIFSWILPVSPPLPSIHMSIARCDCVSCRGAVWQYSFPVGLIAYGVSVPYNRQVMGEGSPSWLFFFYSWRQRNLRFSGSGTMHSATVIWMAIWCCT